MSAIQAVQKLIAIWSIDFYAGWSVMDVFTVGAVLFASASVVNYFFFKAH